MERIIKDVGEIHSRLLDHKVFTQGHTRFFVKEFEEKRGWREEQQAEKLARAVTEMSFTLIPDGETTRNMAAVLSRLQAVNHMSSRILQCENSSDENATLEEGRARRRVAWEQALARSEQRHGEAVRKHEEQVAALRCHYLALGEELHTPTVY
uniref:biogenesis of lysosome-related organelles complex 1 subunit 5 n=1 Tax=Myxine glutinosa TaxID=7769 RepID=UPI00358E89F1